MSLNLAATLRLDNRGFAQPLQQSRGQLAGFTGGLKSMIGPLAAAAAGMASIAAISSQIRQTFAVIASFGAEMSKVGAISGATAEEMVELTKIARELGATTMFSATEAAQGLSNLAMAGFSVRDSIAALPQVLSLAQAGAVDLGGAAEIASNIMAAFAIPASGLGEVVDDLATVASRANTNVEQLGHGIGFAGPIAAAFGISLQEVTAALGVLGDVGMGERAGPQLATIFRMLSKESGTTTKALAEMGLTMADVDPAAHSLRDILEALSTAGMTPSQASAIFGEAAAGILSLTNGVGKLDQLTAAMKGNKGAAKAMADTMGNNLHGDVLKVKSAVEELRLTLGDLGGEHAFRTLAQSAAEAVGTLSSALANGDMWDMWSLQGWKGITMFVARYTEAIANAAILTGFTIWEGMKYAVESLKNGFIGAVAALGDKLNEVLSHLPEWLGGKLKIDTDEIRAGQTDTGNLGDRVTEAIAYSPEFKMQDMVREKFDPAIEAMKQSWIKAAETVEDAMGPMGEAAAFEKKKDDDKKERVPQAQDPLTDRLARIGGFIGESGGPALTAARETAKNTQGMLTILDRMIMQERMAGAWS